MTTKKKRPYTKPRRRGEDESETVSNISRKVIVDIKKGKDKAGKGKKSHSTVSKRVIRRRGEPESESLSEDHLSKREIVDIKKKGKKSVKPRRRDERDIISESSHLSKKVVDYTTKKEKIKRKEE